MNYVLNETLPDLKARIKALKIDRGTKSLAMISAWHSDCDAVRQGIMTREFCLKKWGKAPPESKVDKLTPRQREGKEYWDILSRKQRECLIEAHGGFSCKHASQEYRDLTPSLQEIANEAADTPGGIVKTERLAEIGALCDKWYAREKAAMKGEYPWNSRGFRDTASFYPDQAALEQ